MKIGVSKPADKYLGTSTLLNPLTDFIAFRLGMIQTQVMIGCTMRVAILSSGGKDSSKVWWTAQCKGWDIVAVVTVRITGEDSYMFQIPTTDLVGLQASSAGVDWVQVESSGEQEVEIEDLKMALSKLEIDGIVVGAIRSDYQKSRLERMTEDLGINIWTPIWHQDPEQHMKELIDFGFEVMITGVSCEGLDDSWLGKVLCPESYQKLRILSEKYRFNVDGEGGEYETFVTYAPFMKNKIELNYEKVWDGVRGYLEFKR